MYIDKEVAFAGMLAIFGLLAMCSSLASLLRSNQKQSKDDANPISPDKTSQQLSQDTPIKTTPYDTNNYKRCIFCGNPLAKADAICEHCGRRID